MCSERQIQETLNPLFAIKYFSLLLIMSYLLHFGAVTNLYNKVRDDVKL